MFSIEVAKLSFRSSDIYKKISGYLIISMDFREKKKLGTLTKASLTRWTNFSSSRATNSAPNFFFIDQTRDEYSSFNGKRAIGPVDRNRCHAVLLASFFYI